ncbi:hypothetical protein R3P38DRAFT_3221965 [Favolaschia claudopus]|uniref:Uncharacterized protein n=1 Tax=Favolaschia claudopus TaxID=2862362 RepID=A0AAV9ZIM1_9AGAR
MEELFGVEYTHCGCSFTGTTVGERLSQLIGHGTNPSYLIEPGKLRSGFVSSDPAYLVAVPLSAGYGSGCGSGCGGVDAAEGVAGGVVRLQTEERNVDPDAVADVGVDAEVDADPHQRQLLSVDLGVAGWLRVEGAAVVVVVDVEEGIEQ